MAELKYTRVQAKQICSNMHLTIVNEDAFGLTAKKDGVMYRFKYVDADRTPDEKRSKMLQDRLKILEEITSVKYSDAYKNPVEEEVKAPEPEVEDEIIETEEEEESEETPVSEETPEESSKKATLIAEIKRPRRRGRPSKKNKDR